MRLKNILITKLVLLCFLPALAFCRPPNYDVALNKDVFNPGDTLKIVIGAKKIKNPKIVFNFTEHRVFRQDSGGYRCLIGIPLTVEPGIYELRFEYKRFFGRRSDSAAVIYIEPLKEAPKAENLRFSESVRVLYKSPSVLDGSDQKLLDEAYKIATPLQLWKDKFDLPINSRITSPYGSSRSYNVGSSVRSFHRGTDFSAPLGSKIKAANSGTVVLAKHLVLSGKSVAIDHGQGIISVYKHLSEIKVNEGDSLNKGDVLGLSGSTGVSTAAHLHWEMRVFGVPVNPIRWSEEVF